MNTILTVLMIVLHSVTNTNNRPDIQAFATRPDACRTYNIGGYDMTSGVHCGLDDHQKQSKQDTITIDTVSSNEPETSVTVAPVEKVKKNNGNHYGNDRPDNNPNDTKNKHNGCDKDCTGKNNPTNDKKKDK